MVETIHRVAVRVRPLGKMSVAGSSSRALQIQPSAVIYTELLSNPLLFFRAHLQELEARISFALILGIRIRKATLKMAKSIAIRLSGDSNGSTVETASFVADLVGGAIRVFHTISSIVWNSFHP